MVVVGLVGPVRQIRQVGLVGLVRLVRQVGLVRQVRLVRHPPLSPIIPHSLSSTSTSLLSFVPLLHHSVETAFVACQSNVGAYRLLG